LGEEKYFDNAVIIADRQSSMMSKRLC